MSRIPRFDEKQADNMLQTPAWALLVGVSLGHVAVESEAFGCLYGKSLRSTANSRDFF